MNLWGFLFAAVLLTLMPGPDILFVITQSIRQGKRSGIIFASGLCTGLIFHIVAVSLGLSVVLYNSPFAFMVLKFSGAAYLLFLGVKAFIHRKQASLRFNVEKGSQNKLYRKGILMNILNPKVILFFLAFLPQFVDMQGRNLIGQMFLLGFVFMIQAWVIFSLVAILADKLSVRLMKHPSIAFWINVVEAAIYCSIGVSILFIQ